MTEQVLELCPALIRFIGSIRVREIQVNEIRIKVRDFGVKAIRLGLGLGSGLKA